MARPADHHEDAARWDAPQAHDALVCELLDRFDGWAIAAAADSIPAYTRALDVGARLAIWNKPNQPASGSRVRNVFEVVLVYVPPQRRARSASLGCVDLLTASHEMSGFAGRKPPQWTRWVLAMLGYDPAADEVCDLFPGSGAVSAAADGMLPLDPFPRSGSQLHGIKAGALS